MNGVRKLRGRPSIFVAAILGAILAVGWLSAGAGSTARSALAGTCSVGTWQVRAAMPLDVWSPATTSNGIYAYAAGGYSVSQNDSVAKLYRYDSAANMWTTLAPPPVPLADASAQYSPLTNKIYVFGGAQGQFSTTLLNTTYIYDIATNTWGSGANMPGPGIWMASGYYNGKIYLAGGLPSTAGNTRSPRCGSTTRRRTPSRPAPRCPAGCGEPASA